MESLGDCTHPRIEDPFSTVPGDTSVRAKYGSVVNVCPSLLTTRNCNIGSTIPLSLSRSLSLSPAKAKPTDSRNVNTNLFTKQRANLSCVIAYRGAHATTRRALQF